MMSNMMMNPNMMNASMNHVNMNMKSNIQSNVRSNAKPNQQTVCTNIIESTTDCPKCRGRGWIHESNMKHKGSDTVKCFFCGDCTACNGTGSVKTQKEVTRMRMSNGYTRNVVKDLMRTCGRCKGNGFVHESSMKH